MAITEKAKIVLENIRNRRSLNYRFMRPDPIDETQLTSIFEAANWAPTHRFTEPWRFRVFREAGRARFAKVLGEVYRDFSGDEFLEKKFEKTVTRPVCVPVVVAIVMKPSEKILLPEFEELLAVGCAVQNMHLAAYAMGIGGIWSTPKYLDHPDLREFLGIKGRERCLGFFYLGYPSGAWPSSKRCPVEDKVRYIDE